MNTNNLVTILLLAVHTVGARIDSLDDILVYPLEAPSKIEKREVIGGSGAFIEFVEERLIQHSQALEHLVKMVRKNEELTKQLIENLGKKIEMPKMPQEVEVYHQNRRSSSSVVEDKENPFMRIGRNIPKYGTLFGHIILKEIAGDTDPKPLVELGPELRNSQILSRRSFSGSLKSEALLEDDNKISPWCSIAMLCRRTINPVCGFDDNFGFGKFDDVCHMLTVNCYWKYNFALVPSCKPSL